MADYRRHFEDAPHHHERAWPERAKDEVRSWFGDDRARHRRDSEERDHRDDYGSDRGPRDDRGLRWEGPREDRDYGGYGYAGSSMGAYRTDDRGYHDRYRTDRYRDTVADDYYRAAREQREDFERWEAESPGAPSSWTPRERGGYWRHYDTLRPHYSGRGPKDYRRSDERVREEICDAMTDDPMLDASEITVSVIDGVVTLSGAVTSRDQKRRAEDVADRISGVKDVTNQLRVDREANGHGTTAPQPVTQASGKGTPSKSSGTTA
jgi:hypothetical protein